jgi:hypothetical protein
MPVIPFFIPAWGILDPERKGRGGSPLEAISTLPAPT